MFGVFVTDMNLDEGIGASPERKEPTKAPVAATRHKHDKKKNKSGKTVKHCFLPFKFNGYSVILEKMVFPTLYFL